MGTGVSADKYHAQLPRQSEGYCNLPNGGCRALWQLGPWVGAFDGNNLPSATFSLACQCSLALALYSGPPRGSALTLQKH